MIEAAAKAAHEVNKVWSESLGDQSHEHWENAAEWQRSSSRAGVLKAVDLYENGTPKSEISEKLHESWMEFKAANGWRFGAVKDADKKEHPCMVPYSQLPPEQRVKDEIYLATVLSITQNWWRRPA